MACQLSFGSATPRLAEVLSFKLAAQTAREVGQDLALTHGLCLAPSFLHQVGQRVGEVAVAKAERWQLESPPPERSVAIVATGLDGSHLPLVGEDYKEAMCGTIALYDQRGERLSTEYLGAMPEAGKADFTNRFTSRVARVLALYPKAIHVVLSDGALWNPSAPSARWLPPSLAGVPGGSEAASRASRTPTWIRYFDAESGVRTEAGSS